MVRLLFAPESNNMSYNNPIGTLQVYSLIVLDAMLLVWPKTKKPERAIHSRLVSKIKATFNQKRVLMEK
jgi:hypothetical protein